MPDPPLVSALRDRYVIERELGAGGMATVYLAHDVKHKRKVALKVLRPELAAALGHARFLREIEIAAGLSHPHILRASSPHRGSLSPPLPAAPGSGPFPGRSSRTRPPAHPAPPPPVCP
jgi:hypothetical protein